MARRSNAPCSNRNRLSMKDFKHFGHVTAWAKSTNFTGNNNRTHGEDARPWVS
jgi:hypothetical protein